MCLQRSSDRTEFAGDRTVPGRCSVSDVTSGWSPCPAVTFLATHTLSAIRFIFMRRWADRLSLLVDTLSACLQSLGWSPCQALLGWGSGLQPAAHEPSALNLSAGWVSYTSLWLGLHSSCSSFLKISLPPWVPDLLCDSHTPCPAQDSWEMITDVSILECDIKGEAFKFLQLFGVGETCL